MKKKVSGFKMFCNAVSFVTYAFLLIALVFHLVGVWRIEIGGEFSLYFGQSPCLAFVWLANCHKSDVDEALNKRYGSLPLAEQRILRKEMRKNCIALVFVVLTVVFALGRVMNYCFPSLGLAPVGLWNLMLSYVGFGIFIDIAIIVPSGDSCEKEGQEDEA